MGNACCSFPCHLGDANALDIRSRLSAVQDINQIDELISCIENCLIAIENNSRLQIPDTFQTCINFGKDLLESVLNRVHRQACKMCYRYKLNAATRKIVIDVLKGVGKTHWLGAGVSVLGYILEQIDQISSNKSECMDLLKYMFCLAKRVQQLNEHLPKEKQMLNDVVHFIVEGSLLCLSQMQRNDLYRILSASVDAEDLKSFQAGLAHKYQDLTLVAVIGLLNATPRVLPPSQGECPDAVGIEDARDEVIRLLKMDVNPSRTAVVIYGAGGVGKTTLASAVYSELDLTSYKFCRLDMEDICPANHLKALQRQILYDLFEEQPILRSYTEGQLELKKAFKKATQPVFMFINNALNGSDLEKLLPRDLSCLPKQTKILLTTRRLNETSMLLQRGSIERNEYCVRLLSPSQAKQLLCKTALGSADQSFPASVDVDGLVEKCCGIPLILNLIGSQLREHVDDVSICKDLVTSFKESLTKGEGEMCERVVDVVYNSFKEPSQKEAFLDIVFFFNNSPYRIVSYVVGRDNLKALENAGLVQVCREDNSKQDTGDLPQWRELTEFVKDIDYQRGTVKVVDVIRARGKKLSNSDRIMDDSRSLFEAFRCRQRIKGIWLSNRFQNLPVAEMFAFTSSSLRILHFGNGVRVQEVWKEDFENFRYLSGNDLPVDVNNVKGLAILVGNVSYDVYELPSSLRLLRLHGEPSIPAGLLESLGNLSSLEQLSLDYSSPRQLTLPASFGYLQSLRFLDLSLKLTTLPDSFGHLTALEGLSLKSCRKFASLPETFCELKFLRFLNIEKGILPELPEKFGNLSALEELRLSCPLVSLPASFGELESLRILVLGDCQELTALPEGFAHLSCLQELRLMNASKLECIPVNFGQLTSLKSLHIIGPLCLTTLPEGFGSLSSLEYLNLERCPKLLALPQSFGQLGNLKKLYISGPDNMSTLPDQFGQLYFLQRLSLRNFKSLQKLCPDFQCLISVATLLLAGCPQLEGETIDILVEMKFLMTLDIDESPMLVERWEQVKDQHTLMVSYKQPATDNLAKKGEKKDEKEAHAPICRYHETVDLAYSMGAPKRKKIEKIFENREELRAFQYDDGRLREIISTALFHHKSSFLNIDIGGNWAEWSPSSFLFSRGKLALLLTKCDLSSSINSEALEIVKKKSAELQSKNYHVMYVQVGEFREKNEQLIDQTLQLLSPGTCAWKAPDDKTRQIFAFAVYKLLKRGRNRRWEPWHAAHTLIAGTSVSMTDAGDKRMEGSWKIILPEDEEGNEFEALRDSMGSFSHLFNSTERLMGDRA